MVVVVVVVLLSLLFVLLHMVFETIFVKRQSDSVSKMRKKKLGAMSNNYQCVC